jgi:hypothetical protein
VPRSINSLAVLFVGNRFTNRNDLPGLLERLALAGKPSRNLVTARILASAPQASWRFGANDWPRWFLAGARLHTLPGASAIPSQIQAQ